jgi:hypothetical protein
MIDRRIVQNIDDRRGSSLFRDWSTPNISIILYHSSIILPFHNSLTFCHSWLSSQFSLCHRYSASQIHKFETNHWFINATNLDLWIRGAWIHSIRITKTQNLLSWSLSKISTWFTKAFNIMAIHHSNRAGLLGFWFALRLGLCEKRLNIGRQSVWSENESEDVNGDRHDHNAWQNVSELWKGSIIDEW